MTEPVNSATADVSIRNADFDAGAEIDKLRRAGVISSLTGADGLVEIPFATAEIASGQPVRFYPFHEVV